MMNQERKPLSAMSEQELRALIHSEEEIKYGIEHVYNELLFRDMMKQWEEDTEELEERERRKDEGCGHDQNERYYE